MADSKDLARKESDRSTHELQKSKEDSDPKPFINSPARHDNVSNRNDNDSTYRRGGHNLGSADNQKPARQSTGSEHSIERSPLHRQAKNPGTDSPSWEGKNSSHNSHSTPGRSRLNPVNRGNESVSFLFFFLHFYCHVVLTREKCIVAPKLRPKYNLGTLICTEHPLYFGKTK